MGEVDFFITMGRYDANPTTLAETALWGLLGACTVGSGYYPDQPFIGLTDNLGENLETIDRLQNMPEPEIKERVSRIQEWVKESHSIENRQRVMWARISELLGGVQ